MFGYTAEAVEWSGVPRGEDVLWNKPFDRARLAQVLKRALG